MAGPEGGGPVAVVPNEEAPRAGDAHGEAVAGLLERVDGGVDELAAAAVGPQAGALGPAGLALELYGELGVALAGPDGATGAGADAGDAPVL